MDFTRIFHPFLTSILACGGELKSSFCLAEGDCAFLSKPFGDLENLQDLSSFEEEIEQAITRLGIRPKVIAYDIHPEYLSTKYAFKLSSITSHLIPVQHHHAHIASCMAENCLDEKVIGVAFDGLGFGEDGSLWGGEFLIADYATYERKAHLRYVPLVSGRQAIKEPWRMAGVWLYATFGRNFLKLDIDFVRLLKKDKWDVLKKMLESKFNSPLTSSMGRLFDSVSSLIGMGDRINYEGELAIKLEKAMESCIHPVLSYKFEIRKEKQILIIEPKLIFKEIVEDLRQKKSAGEISKRFHLAVVQIIKEVCLGIKKETGLNKVVLSGGVFQNRFLFENTPLVLKSIGFDVFAHFRIPTNDLGIALGQAVIANKRIKQCV